MVGTLSTVRGSKLEMSFDPLVVPGGACLPAYPPTRLPAYLPLRFGCGVGESVQDQIQSIRIRHGRVGCQPALGLPRQRAELHESVRPSRTSQPVQSYLQSITGIRIPGPQGGHILTQFLQSTRQRREVLYPERTKCIVDSVGHGADRNLCRVSRAAATNDGAALQCPCTSFACRAAIRALASSTMAMIGIPGQWRKAPRTDPLRRAGVARVRELERHRAEPTASRSGRRVPRCV